MASNGQNEKIGDDTPAGSGRPIDSHGEKNVGQEGDIPYQSRYYNEDNLQVWRDRCLRRDEEVKEMANKLADLQSIVNFMMQNNDTPIPAANTQRGGQKTIPVAPQHTRSERHSHRLSREVRRGESRREESRKTYRTKEADPKHYTKTGY
ncbi:hypothetical protein ACSBR1_041478 [Camellia fascicularis]